MPELKQLEKVIWNNRVVSQEPDIKPSGKDFLMDTMPFNAVLKEKLTDNKPLQYLCEGKYISFKPVGGQSSRGSLSKDKRNVTYKNALGQGISLEIQTSQSHWKKLIKIDSLQSLGDIKDKKFVEFTFEVESDFSIPERENKKPRIKLGDNSFIEIATARDSSPVVFNEETGETSENKIPIKSYFKRVDGTLLFIKQIPTAWLKQAVFPVWTDLDITWGTASEFESGVTVYICCCEISSDKFVVAFRDVGDGGAGKARVATVSGTTITWGTVSEFCSNVTIGYSLGICKLDTDKFVVVYTDDAQLDDGYARAATVSGTTISWGTAKEFETGDTEYPSCCQLSTDKFVVCYNDEGDSDKGKACVCTVSGTTITAGTPVVFADKNTAWNENRCCKLTTDKFLILWRDASDSYYLKGIAATVSGTTPSFGSELTIDSINASAISCAQLDTDKAVIVWRDGTNTHGAIEIVTVSGTTITEGTEVDLNPTSGDIQYNAVAKVDDTHFVVIYEDIANSEKGTSRYCSFSGTTITLGSEEVFHDAQISYMGICLISSNKVAVCYCDDADVNNHGEGICGTKVANVTVTPSTLALTLTEYAPSVIIGTIVTPSTLALSLTGYAPVIKLKVIPPTLALTITTYAPTVLTPRLVTPSTLALSLTEYTPSVTIGTIITPATLALSLTTYAPSVTIGVRVTPSTLALTLTTYAPTIQLPQLVTPSTLALTLAMFAPDAILGTTLAAALAYIIEARNSSGDLLAILQNAHGIGLTEELNRPPMLDFLIPADDDKLTHISQANQVWLRDYDTGSVLYKFILSRRGDTRD